jgi:hypothetical protein
MPTKNHDIVTRAAGFSLKGFLSKNPLPSPRMLAILIMWGCGRGLADEHTKTGSSLDVN